MFRPYRKGMYGAVMALSNGYYWESSGMGWSSLLCMGEDNNGCGCVGKRSSRHPRCFEQRHDRKEA